MESTHERKSSLYWTTIVVNRIKNQKSAENGTKWAAITKRGQCPMDDVSFFPRRQRKEIAKTISTKNLKTCADIEFHNMSAYSVCVCACAVHWLNASIDIGTHNSSYLLFLFFLYGFVAVCLHSAHQPIWSNRLFYFFFIFFFVFGQRIDANKNKRNYTHQQVVVLVFVWRRTKLKNSNVVLVWLVPLHRVRWDNCRCQDLLLYELHALRQ